MNVCFFFECIIKNIAMGNIMDEGSYLFSKKNPFRLFMYKTYKHKLFDNTIMALIGLSSIKLAADSYLASYAPDSIEIQISE